MRNSKVIGKKIAALALFCVLSVSSVTSVFAAEQRVLKRRAFVQKEIEETPETETTETIETIEEEAPLYSPEDLQYQGVIWHEGYRYTWYTERVLPGPGLNIPGRHVDENGYVCDEDDFIVIASRDLAKGTEVDIPFGKKGKVYDWCAISGTLDVYTNW